MSNDVQDLRSTIIPRSDQLNSEQLLGGPMILTVTDVRAGGGEDQPVSIYYESDPARPFKPCKTMRKVLILAWGPDGTQWIGKSMELYNEPSVKFGGEVVGGIRISRLTDIQKDIKVSLTATKGRKALHEIGLLQLSAAVQKVLKAIEAANNKETLQKARALAEALESAADIAIARAAYAKRVAELKTKAAAPKPPVINAEDDASAGTDPDLPVATFDEVKAQLEAAKTPADYEAARARIAQVEDAMEQAQLNALATKRYAAISEGE
jgi:hypothetical protein